MSFGQSIKTVFGNLTNFKGRARRSEFWWFYLFIVLVTIPLSILAYIPMFGAIGDLVDATNPDGTLQDGAMEAYFASVGVTLAISLVLGLITFLLTLAVWVRRLHDAGYSGHLLWLNLIGLGIVPLIFAILEGNPYENKYGPDPKAATFGAWPAAPQTSPTYAQAPAGYDPTQPPPGVIPTAPTPPPYTPPADPGPDMVSPPPAAGDPTDPFAAPPR